VYTSLANAQNWAIIMLLKIPTHTKNATPRPNPDTPICATM
jgi:hypothetical protein